MMYLKMRCLLFQYYIIILMCISSTWLLSRLIRSNTGMRSPKISKAVKDMYHIGDVYDALRWRPVRTQNNSRWVLDSSIKNSIVEPVINPEALCDQNSNDTKQLIVIVLSKVENFKRRSAIRRTWGSSAWRESLDIVFVVGQSNQRSNFQLIKESTTFMDIIQGEFDDKNRNTLKYLMALKWVKKYCRNSRYILRVLDNVFANIPNILDTIEAHSFVQNIYLGSRVDMGRPVRDRGGKDYVPRYVYPYTVFPLHLDRSATLMRMEIVEIILESCSRVDIFIVEEVYVSGICRSMANIKIHNHDYFVRDKSMAVCDLFSMDVMREVDPESMIRIWDKINKFDANLQVIKSFCGQTEPHKAYPVRLPL